MKPRDTIDLLLLAAMWGASFLFMRIAGPEFGPVSMVGLRVLIGTLTLLPIMLLKFSLTDLGGRWSNFVVLGALTSAIPFILLTYSTLHITGGFASILNATTPLWAATVAWAWLSDRLTAGQIIGLVMGFAGVYLLSRDKLEWSFDGTSLAIVAAIVASLFYGIAANYVKKSFPGVASLVVATGSQIGATILVLPAAIYFWPTEPVSLRAWAAVILIGTLSSGLAYILYFRLIESIGPTRAISVTYLVPLFAMIWGALVIDETVTLNMLAGCAIILLGTALATGLLRINAR